MCVSRRTPGSCPGSPSRPGSNGYRLVAWRAFPAPTLGRRGVNALRLVRTGFVAAAGITAALALAGCGGGRDQRLVDDRGKDTGPVSSPTSGGARTPVSSPTPSPAASPVTSGEAEGSWVGLTDGKPVSVTIKKGHALVLAEAHVCQGTAHGTDTVTLSLTCDDGYTARTEGSARADKAKLAVTWAGGAKDTLTKAETP
uniref:Membrane protein n=1 Tax=Streptomyces sp. SANK 60404 TaxID=1213862 RepID=A0A1B4ZDF7_9ACTN|nr:membrane protein [Streptomyces sp. SANK 60404]